MVTKEGIWTKQWQGAVVKLVVLFRDPMRKLERKGVHGCVKKGHVHIYIYCVCVCVKIIREGSEIVVEREICICFKGNNIVGATVGEFYSNPMHMHHLNTPFI